jgi:hypothetical protein
MKSIVCIFTISFIILASCATDDPYRNERKKAVDYMSVYLDQQLVDSKISVDTMGIVTLADKQEEFKIDPFKIVFGQIDTNHRVDAVIPVFTFRNGSIIWIQHFVLLDSDNSYRIIKNFNDILKVIEIRDHQIVAEVSTVSPDSPGFGCSQCRVVKRFVYKDLNIIQVE